jgi:hypothetical protein
MNIRRTKDSNTQSPYIYIRLAPAVPTVVYETYWRFATERQNIFFRRMQFNPYPWTCDPILREYKFTNAYRASDRVSQYLIRNVIYTGDPSPEEVLFRILLFKVFNKIETWELLNAKLGKVIYKEYSYRSYNAILNKALSEGKSIFSAAYIMPSGCTSYGSNKKHTNILRLIENIMRDKVALKIMQMKSMQRAFDVLRSYPMIGDFLAYQYVTDINYSELTHFSEMDFVIPGPGARNGIRKCFVTLGGLNEVDIIKLMADKQEDEFKYYELNFRTLWGRPLQLIDCQNLFCEVDKYARMAHPEIDGITKRKQIKQKFRPKSEPIPYWYPPKWNLNDKINQSSRVNKEISILK